MKKLMALLLATLMMTSAFSACQTDKADDSGDKDSSSSSTDKDAGKEEDKDAGKEEDKDADKDADADADAAGDVSTGPDDTSEHYSFEVYASYDWWTAKGWGQDDASKAINDKFNVDLTWTSPDSDAATKLNLMIANDSLPDSLVMDRNADYIKLANLGYLVELDSLMYEGNYFDQQILPSTKALLAIDGKSYGVPNWARSTATGGNFSWLVNEAVAKDLGLDYTADFTSLEQIEAYMQAVVDAAPKSAAGESIFPFLTDYTDNGFYVYTGIYRSLGGANTVESYFTQDSGSLVFGPEDPMFVEALKKANDWYKKGYYSETVFTDSKEQILEKMSTGRGAIMYYDFSQDAVNHFRQILLEDTGMTYEVLTDPIYPPAEGVTKVYGEESGTTGWNVNIISKNAENPQRIFDVFTWMLTKEGSANMMYGAEGTYWDGWKDEKTPNLLVDFSTLTAEELTQSGSWTWAQPAHSDTVDNMKFAINAQLPEESQDFTVTLQASVFSEKAGGEYKDGQKFCTDENANINTSIDPTSDLGINRQMIYDKCKEMLPQIMTAKDDATFDSKLQELIDFAYDYSLEEVLEAYNGVRDSNIEIQGWSYYN